MSSKPAPLTMSSTDKQLLELFKTVDTDNSGFIGIEEVTDMCLKFGASESDAVEIFEKLDRDRDGKVSFEDFSAGFDDYEKGVLLSGPLSPTSPLVPKPPSIGLLDSVNNNNVAIRVNGSEEKSPDSPTVE